MLKLSLLSMVLVALVQVSHGIDNTTNLYLVADQSRQVPCDAVSGTKSIVWRMRNPNGSVGEVEVTNDNTQRVYYRTHLPELSRTLVITRAQPSLVYTSGGDFLNRFTCTRTYISDPDVDNFVYNIETAVAPVSALQPEPALIIRNESIGNQETLRCQDDIAARPRSLGDWNIQLENGESRVLESNMLSVDLNRSNAGFYQCILQNIAGQLPPVNTTIVINYPPDVSLSSPSISEDGRIAMGADLNLSCSVNGVPNINSVEFVFLNMSHNASVSQAERVLYRVDTPPAYRNFTVYHVVNSVDRYANVGMYSCRARNLLGYRNSSLSVDVIAPPSAPRNLTLINRTTTEVTVDWHTPLQTGGDPITHYRLSCSASTGTLHNFTQDIEHNITIRNITADDVAQTNMSVNATNRHTFRGLFAGETYDCMLAAVNFAGVGEFSNAVSFQTLAAAPCTPLITSIENGISQICISWQIDCDSDSSLTGCYLAKAGSPLQNFTEPDNFFCRADGQVKTLCDTENLVVGQTYMYDLVVRNSIGSSQGSTAVRFTGKYTTTEPNSTVTRKYTTTEPNSTVTRKYTTTEPIITVTTAMGAASGCGGNLCTSQVLLFTIIMVLLLLVL